VFDAEHQRLFSFLLNTEHEMVTVRATASGPRPEVAAQNLAAASTDPSEALRLTTEIWVDDAFVQANVYDRGRLAAGNVVHGPAIITEMDSTTLVLPGHEATVHVSGSLLIRPNSAEKTQEA
jgi:N-methylhydantoinase A